MAIEIRLKQVLQERGLYTYGVEKRIADACGVHRHTIGSLLRSKMKNPSLSILDKVCRWLIDMGVPSEELPGALFAFRPPTLWRAIAGRSKVVIYLGMYVHSSRHTPAVPAPMSIARHDAEVATNIINLLNSRADMGDSVPKVRTQYVPFQYTARKPSLTPERFENDKKGAQEIFAGMCSRKDEENAILLGSQRVNYVVECMVADLFGCDPFEPVRKIPKVPFYLLYRDFDQPVPSCFGGPENPGWLKGNAPCGTYYLDPAGKWNLIEWKQQEQDAGMVIVVRDGKTIDLAAFGFSGRATKAIGTKLIEESRAFWSKDVLNEVSLEGSENSSAADEKPKRGRKKKEKSNTVLTKKGQEIGVYVGRVTFSQNGDPSQPWEEGNYTGDTVQIIPLGESVLEPYLNRGTDRVRS